MRTDPNKVIYSMIRVSKFHDKKPVIKDISLSYFLWGQNRRTGFERLREKHLAENHGRRGSRRTTEKPSLPKDTPSGTWSRSRWSTKPKPYGKSCRKVFRKPLTWSTNSTGSTKSFAEPMSDDEMDQLIQHQGEVQEKLDAMDAWDLDARLEMAMDALRCPPGDMPVNVISGGERRRVALVPPAAEKAGHSAPRRAHQPSGCRIGGMAGTTPAAVCQGTIIAVTHDRYFLDNVAGWILELDRGHGIPWKGNYSSWLEQKQNRLANRRKIRKRTPEDP
jgi:sulfate-transporting ATPase